MVQGIRSVQDMLGDGLKQPQPIEQNTRDVARRSLVVMRNLARGHRLSDEDLGLRRPGTGIAPDQWEQAVGRRLAVDLQAHTTLEWSMLAAQE
jgi:sialic acid synthase SpsE